MPKRRTARTPRTAGVLLLRAIGGVAVPIVGAVSVASMMCTPFETGEASSSSSSSSSSTSSSGTVSPDGAPILDGASLTEDGTAPGGPSTYAAVILNDTPIAYWRFNEPTGSTIAVSEVNAPTMNARIINGAQLTFGMAGPLRGANTTNKAFEFSGQVGPVIESDNALFDFKQQDAFSLEAWFRSTGIDAVFRHIFVKDTPAGSQRNEYGVFFQDTATNPGAPNCGLTFERFVANSDRVVRINSAGISLFDWHHVVAVYNGATMVMYLDGVLTSPVADARSQLSKSLPLRIGAKSAELGAFKGGIDEVAVYNRALTKADVDRHFAARALP